MTDRLDVLVAKIHSALPRSVSCLVFRKGALPDSRERRTYFAFESKKPKRSLLTLRLSIIASMTKSDCFTASPLA